MSANTTTANSNNNNNIPQLNIDTQIITRIQEKKLNYLSQLIPKSSFVIDGKEYTRKKIKPKDRIEILKLSQELEKIENPSSTEYLEKEHEILLKKANLYLGMTAEEVEESDYDTLADVIEACDLRTKGFRV